MLHLLPAVLFLLLSGLATAQPISWFPLEAGATREFRVHTDLTVDRSAQPRVRTFTHERSTIEAFAGPSPSWVELREERNFASEAGAPAPTRRGSVVLQASPWGIVQKRSGAAAGDVGARLRLLKRSPKPGDRWEVGLLRVDGFEVAASAEVVGLEDVTLDDATRTGCVHVAYRGDIAGEFALGGQRHEVERGSWNADRWFCPGEGPVKSVIRTDLAVTLEDLNEVQVARIETRTLAR